MLADIALLFPALIFTVLGAALLYTFVRSLWIAIFGNTRGLGERARFKRREQNLKRADTAIRQGEFLAALKLIEAAFFFDHIRKDQALIDQVVGHHIGVLGRLIAISEEEGHPITGLAVIEDLVHSRGELMRAYMEATSTRDSLGKNRKKAVPRWALDEYDKKMSEILERLSVNKRSLASQFQVVISDLRKPLSAVRSQDGSSVAGGDDNPDDMMIH